MVKRTSYNYLNNLNNKKGVLVISRYLKKERGIINFTCGKEFLMFDKSLSDTEVIDNLYIYEDIDAKTKGDKMTSYKQKRQTEKKTELQIKLNKGKVLKNKTNGYVFLNFLTKKQVKINQGKRRKNRDFRFSKPKYWEVLSPWKSFKIKSMYYLGLKRFI